MSSYDCHEHHDDTPEDCSYDWAYPHDWIVDVQKRLRPTGEYRPLGGHIIWRYGPNDGCLGRPVGLCAEAQAVIDAYERVRAEERARR